MTVKGVFALLGAVVLTASAAFHCGARVSRSTYDAGRERSSHGSEALARPRAAHDDDRQQDYVRVTIENVDRLDFAQTYELLRTSPREALSYWAKRLEDLPASARRSAAIASFYKTLAQVDAAAAVDLVLQTMDRDARADAFTAVQATVAPADLHEIGRLYIGLNAPPGGLTGLFLDWSEHDPVSASKFADSHPEKLDSYGVRVLVNNWAQIDPGAAHAWLDRVDATHKDASVYEGFYSGWLESDRSAAAADLITRAGRKEFRAAVTHAAARLFRAGEAEARDFVLKLPDAASQRAALHGVRTYAASIDINDEEQPAPRSVLANWLLDLPPQVAAEQIGDVVWVWSAEEPKAVQAWLGQMPSAKRDGVLSRVCQAFLWDDARRSYEAGFQIEDERLREQSLRAALQKTGSQERARELIERMQLPPAQSAQLQQIAAEL